MKRIMVELFWREPDKHGDIRYGLKHGGKILIAEEWCSPPRSTGKPKLRKFFDNYRPRKGKEGKE